MNEEEIGMRVQTIGINTLKELSQVFKDGNFDDKKATLILYYFLIIFIRYCWKDNKPVDVIKNLIDIIKETDNNFGFNDQPRGE